MKTMNVYPSINHYEVQSHFRLCKCKFLMINAHERVRAPTYQQVMQGPISYHPQNHEHLSFLSWSTKCIFCSKGPATFDVRFIVLRSGLTPYHHDMAPWSALKSWNANTNLLLLCDLSTPSIAWYFSFPFSRLTSEVYRDLHRHVTSLPPFFF